MITDMEHKESKSGLSPDEKKKLGCYLRLLREEKHLSQEEFAEIMGCTPQYISDVERGKYSFTSSTLSKRRSG